jgi:farnesyl diphosphate synthase
LAATGQSISLAQLKRLHSLKTGALLKAAVIMPSLCSKEVTVEHSTILTEFSQLIGLAYQVQDDIIDLTSSDEELGKPSGSDLAANKSTYPSLLGLQGAQQKAENLLQQALQALARLPYNTQSLENFATFIVKRSH